MYVQNQFFLSERSQLSSGYSAYAREIARIQGSRREETDKILLALEEAVVNIVKHAFEDGENALYEVTFDLVTSGITIT
jgi:anti-sigma regulatory factor (Ser/Thr protein kinase)